MSKHQLLLNSVRTVDPSKIAAGAVVTLALLFGMAHVSSARDSNFPARASNFALLANAAVTSTGGSITGDVGTFLATPTGSVTLTGCPIMGTVHAGDGTAKMAFNDFTKGLRGARAQAAGGQQGTDGYARRRHPDAGTFEGSAS